jgi:hypothetical protein
MNSVSPATIPMFIVPMTFLFVLLVILTAKSPKTGAWLIGGLVCTVLFVLLRVARGGGVPGPTSLPLVIVPTTFLFVLLVVLTARSPKVGAWLIGGLVLTVPFLLFLAFGRAAGSTSTALPLIIVPMTFLFILLVILISKEPKAGAVLIVALVIMGLFGMFFTTRVSYQGDQTATIVQQTMPAPPAYSQPGPSRSLPQPSATPAPIWAPGVDKELDADVYPSKLAAVEAIGWRMDKSVRELIGDVNSPVQITLFQEVSEPGLIASLRDAIQRALPLATCTVEANLRDVQRGELGVITMVSGTQMQPAPWSRSSESRVIDGMVQVRLSAMGKQRVTLQKQFVDTPWVENFATFASTRPQQAFIIARSLGTCTSESEANQQALDDARARLTEAIGNRPVRKLGPSSLSITATDVLNGGFIVDRFAQSFEGSAGKIWRQALLIDVSGLKLAQLSTVKVFESRQIRESWARMGLSAIGVILLIGVIYFFLNMATMGYYEWSLRIAGVVLAIVAVISILMVVR